MSDDLLVPGLPPKRIRHEGTCELCHTECSRDPGGTWYNFYGRDQCKLDPGEGPHVVRTFTEVEVEPTLVPAMAEITLFYRDADGQSAMLRQSVPEGGAFDATFEPMTVFGFRLESRPPKLVLALEP